MRTKRFGLRLVRKVLFSALGVYIIYKLVYSTGVWAIFLSLYRLIQRAHISEWLNVFK